MWRDSFVWVRGGRQTNVGSEPLLWSALRVAEGKFWWFWLPKKIRTVELEPHLELEKIGQWGVLTKGGENYVGHAGALSSSSLVPVLINT